MLEVFVIWNMPNVVWRIDDHAIHGLCEFLTVLKLILLEERVRILFL